MPRLLGSSGRCIAAWPLLISNLWRRGGRLLANRRLNVRPLSLVRVEHGPVYVGRLLWLGSSLHPRCVRLRPWTHVLEPAFAHGLRVRGGRPWHYAVARVVARRSRLFVHYGAIDWLRLRRTRHRPVNDPAIGRVGLCLRARVHASISIGRHSALYFDRLRPFRRTLSYAALRSTRLWWARHHAYRSGGHSRRLRIAGSLAGRRNSGTVRCCRRIGRCGLQRGRHSASHIYWLAIHSTPQLLFGLLIQRTTRICGQRLLLGGEWNRTLWRNNSCEDRPRRHMWRQGALTACA